MSADRRFPCWVQHAGVGLEFAGAVAGFTAVGYWIDAHYGTKPWGTLIGVFLGLTGGLYNLVKESLQASRDATEEDAEAAAEKKRGDG